MRIVAGTLKGRRLDGPTWDGVRPTSDSLRETLFNVLGPSVHGQRVLDAFSGTGAVGFEALSRGAAHATLLDQDPRAIALIGRHAEKLGVTGTCTILRADWLKPRRGEVLGPFELVFLDPPYAIDSLDDVLARAATAVVSGGRVVLEHSRRRPSPEALPGLRRTRVLEAGDSALSFYTAEVEA